MSEQHIKPARFAHLQGVNRSTVKRWADAGRIVLVDGLVDVAASVARLAATETGARPDLTARHEADRLQKTEKQAAQANSATKPVQPSAASSEIPPDASVEGDSGENANVEPAMRDRLIDIRTKREAVMLEMAEMERDQKRGELMPIAEVEAALEDVLAFVRQGFENMPHAVAGSLVGQNFQTIYAILRDHIANTMRDMHAKAQRERAELVKGESA